MMSAEWEQQRSAFNHGWLKNRLVVCLLRCKRAASGAVQDDMARADLRQLVDGWEAVRQTGAMILEEIDRRLSAEITPTREDMAAFGRDVAHYLLEIERRRWVTLRKPLARSAEAVMSLSALNDVMVVVRRLLLEREVLPAMSHLSKLESQARKLAADFSALTVCRDIILYANDHA
jgi:hypothetical protein